MCTAPSATTAVFTGCSTWRRCRSSRRGVQSQGISTRDDVSVDVSAVANFTVGDAVKSVVEIENVHTAVDQIAQTTLRKVIGRHTL
ncbi:MAG: SPFH domain-containing protein, partial [Umezawaea sp.]